MEPLRLDLVAEWNARAVPSADRPGSHSALHARIGAFRRSLAGSLPDFPLHAGACELASGHAVLAVGKSRSGKSTLMVDLAIERQAALISDDTVWIGNDFAKGIGIPAAIRNDSPRFPCAQGLWYADSSDRLLVRPDDLGAPVCTYQAPIRWLAFVTHGTEHSQYARLDATESFCRLLTSVFRATTDLELLNLAQVVARSSSASLAYTTSEESVEMCDRLFEERPEPAITPKLLSQEWIAEHRLAPHVSGIAFGDDAALVDRSSGQIAQVRDICESTSLSSDLMRQLAAAGISVI